MQDSARWCKMVQQSATLCKMVPDGARWCKFVQDGAKWCEIMQYHAIPCNTLQYHAIPCNTNSMQYHACLITVDGAYHCPVGSIWLFFPSGNDYTNHTILLYSAPPRRDHILYRTSQHFSNVSMYSMSLKLPLSASKESISLFSPY